MEQISQGVWLAWLLASKRAAAANKREISSAQLFCAILELDRRPPEARTGGLEESKLMSAQLLGEELQRAIAPMGRQAIDLHRLTQRLVREAGAGKASSPQTQALHRSAALRAAFDQAMLFADEARREGIELSDLAAALLEQPGAVVRRVLVDSGLDVDRLAREMRLGRAIDGMTDELN